jgi:hypothetical protein
MLFSFIHGAFHPTQTIIDASVCRTQRYDANADRVAELTTQRRKIFP